MTTKILDYLVDVAEEECYKIECEKMGMVCFVRLNQSHQAVQYGTSVLLFCKDKPEPIAIFEDHAIILRKLGNGVWFWDIQPLSYLED